jgi:CRP-like cAMP-binding protein
MSQSQSKDPVVLERRFVPKDAKIIRQGEEGHSAYLIQGGTVSIFTTKEDGSKVELAQMGPGQIFGEMALLFDGPRSASVMALEDCNLIVMTRQTFKHKLEKSDPTIRALLKMLTNRIVEGNNTVINKKSSLDDLTDTTRTIYENVHQTLPRGQQRTFQNAVLPKLEEFLDSIRAFKDRFGED